MDTITSKTEKGVFHYSKIDKPIKLYCEYCMKNTTSNTIIKWEDVEGSSKLICNSCYGSLLFGEEVQVKDTTKNDKFKEEVKLRRNRKKEIQDQFKGKNLRDKKIQKDKKKVEQKRKKSPENPLNPNGYKYGSVKIISTPMGK